jgi:transposase-like protein
LGKWHFTYQKPAVVAYEQSRTEVQLWIKQRYPLIRQKAKKQRGIIFWADEVGMRSQHQAGKSFAPKGQTPVIKKSGQRFYLNMISALSNKGQLVFMIVRQRFNYRVFICFLDKLLKQAAGTKVFLIADGGDAMGREA